MKKKVNKESRNSHMSAESIESSITIERIPMKTMYKPQKTKHNHKV